MKDVNALCGMVEHYHVEAMTMHWRKYDLWKAAITVASILLFLVLMVWVPVSAAGAQEGPSALAGPATGTVQATSTVDLTVTALVKDQLQQQDDKLKRENSGFWPYWLTINGFIGTIFLAGAALLGAWFGFRQWRGNQKEERVKRSEERFKSVVEGLGGEKSAETKIVSAVLLRTFLGRDYGKFYTQVFDLAVANLQPQEHTESANSQPHTPLSREATVASVPKSPASLNRAFINVFKEAFPLARDELNKPGSQFDSQLLDATRIQLDNAFLWQVDLSKAWMPEASLKDANLTAAMLSPIHLKEAHLEKALLKAAKLSKANLIGANLSGADLESAELIGAVLTGAHLDDANLTGAYLTNAILGDANLTGAKLSKADLSGADLSEADLSGADLSKADLSGADLSNANLVGANLRVANNLGDAKLYGARYNMKTRQAKDAQGNPLTFDSTQWPQDFDPKAAGLNCLDC